MIRTTILLIAVLALAGCAGRDWNNWFSSKATPASTQSIEEEAIQTLADDAAKRLANHYPPGRTILYMEPDNTIFLQAFEDKLRSHGFLFNATQGGKNALDVYARLDAIQGETETQWYLYVRLSDGFSFGHLYALDGQNHFIPVGVLSQTPAFFQLIDDGSGAPDPVTAKGEEWRIRPGELKPQMSSWAGRAGYRLVWKSPHDFEMHTDAVFNDTFVGAIKRLFAGMQQSGNALKVKIHTPNKVIEVSER